MMSTIADLLSRSLLWVFGLTLCVSLVRYAVVAGGAWVLLWRGAEPRYPEKRVGRGAPRRGQLRREIAYSVMTCFLFPCSVLMTIALADVGLTRVYFYVDEYGWAYLFASVVLMVILHDALFYWTHRLLHTRWLMRHVHGLHHRSVDPTPWAAFTFHPLEGFLQVFNIVIIVLIVPAHPLALSLFLLLNALGNVFGHCGFEFFSPAFREGRPGRWLNSPAVHGWHHREGRHNFCLYFTFWDRIMRTWQAPPPEFFSRAVSKESQ